MLTVIPFRPGVVKDDPAYTARGYATDSDKIRWVRGHAQSMGGYARASAQVLIGKCRGLIAYTVQYVSTYGYSGFVVPTLYYGELGMGTSSRLYVYDTRAQFSVVAGLGTIYDITPIRASGTLPNNPIATTSGSKDVIVTLTNNKVQNNDLVYIGNPAGITVNNVFLGVAADGTFSNNPFTTAAGSPFVLVNQAPVFPTAVNPGDLVTITGSAAVGGITPNGTFRVFGGNAGLGTYYIEFTSNATSTATGGGAGAGYSYKKAYNTNLAVQSVDLTTSFQITQSATANATGSGGGAALTYQFGFNSGLTQASGAFPPMTWSMDHYGSIMIGNPRNDTIYKWPLNLSVPAVAITNAPAVCLAVVVTPERFILACGCTSSGGTFDPLLVRWPDQTDITQWTPAVGNLAGSLQISQGSQVIGVKNSKAGTLLWTDTALYQIQYTGNLDGLYQAVLLGTQCGLAGPNAAIDANGVAVWISPAFQFFIYDGGTPRPLPCPVRRYFADDVLTTDGFQIFASFDSLYSAVQWQYPSAANNYDCDKYVRVDLIEAANDPKAGWSIGTFDRSAWVDRGVFATPMAVSAAITPYGGAVLYNQETGTSADGGAYAGKLTWAPLELPDPKDGNGNHTAQIRRIVQDLMDYGSGCSLTLTPSGQAWSNGSATTKGPYSFSASTLYQDTHFTARQIANAWTWSGTNIKFRFGDMRVDVSRGPLA